MRKKVDANQKDIVRRFKALYCAVIDLSAVGRGCPDLLVGCIGKPHLVEVKSAKGKLTKDQVRVFDGLHVDIVRSVGDVEMLVAIWRMGDV